MQAVRTWINHDYEGVVHPGQIFDAHQVRATELRMLGLAVPAVSDDEKIVVVADKPTKVDEPTKVDRPAGAARRARS